MDELQLLEWPDCMANHIFLDVETTGLNSWRNEIVEICIINDSGVLVDTLVKPELAQSWPEAQNIHGISPAMVADAPTYKELTAAIADAVRDKVVVIYNADFDSGFLTEPLKEAASIQCCMEAFAEYYGDFSEFHQSYCWQKLTIAAQHVCHQMHGSAHRAKADVLACRAVWHFLTDPKERARVEKKKEAIQEQLRRKYAAEKVEREALFLLRNIAFLEKMELEERIEARHTEILENIRTFLRRPDYPRPPADENSKVYQNRLNRLSILFTGYSATVNEKLALCKEAGIPIFHAESDVPGILIKANDPLAESRLLTDVPERGLLIKHGGQSCIDLYNRRAVKNAPEIFKSWRKVPAEYVSMTTLKKQGYKNAQISKMKRVGCVYGKYRDTWLYDSDLLPPL